MNDVFPDEASYAVLDPILFGDYWAAASEEDARLYEDMQDYEVCKAVVEEVGQILFDTVSRSPLKRSIFASLYLI